MKAIYCPIETSLNFQQANKLLKELKPGVVVIPESYTQPPAIAPHKTDLVIEKQVKHSIIIIAYIWIGPKLKSILLSVGQTTDNIQTR